MQGTEGFWRVRQPINDVSRKREYREMARCKAGGFLASEATLRVVDREKNPTNAVRWPFLGTPLIVEKYGGPP